MTSHEYLDRAKIYALQHPDQRIGQAMMNSLREISPIAYADIPEHVDPFYDNDLVTAFIVYVVTNWNRLTMPIHSQSNNL